MFDTLLASSNAGGAIAIIFIVIIVYAIIFAVLGAFMWWGVFQKAGEPAWASAIPVYNLVVLLRVAGQSPWWALLLLVWLIPFVDFFLGPIANLVIFILTGIGVARAFGKTGGFAVGLILLSIIFYPILGYGSAQYVGAEASTSV